MNSLYNYNTFIIMRREKKEEGRDNIFSAITIFQTCSYYFLHIGSLNLLNKFISFSVTHSHPTLCAFLDCSTWVSPVQTWVCSNSCPWSRDAIQSSHHLLPPSLPALNFSQHQGLFSFSISPSNEYSELITYRIDWCDLAVWRTLQSLL